MIPEPVNTLFPIRPGGAPMQGGEIASRGDVCLLLLEMLQLEPPKDSDQTSCIRTNQTNGPKETTAILHQPNIIVGWAGGILS
jgi:hypothetical protein